MSSPKSRRRFLLVLGMHRSGTSAAARVANLLGADLGDHLIAPASDNPDGFWEHADAVKINEDLLEGLGRTWYDMREMPHGWMETKAAKDAFERIKALVKGDFASSALPAIKDPRICLTAPVWIEALGDLGFEADCLFVVRNPREVVESLHVRNDWAREPLFLMWVQYLMAAEAATRGCRRALVTYDGMLSDWRATMEIAAQELDIEWPAGIDAAAIDVEAFLQGGRRHHKAAPPQAAKGAGSDMPELAAKLYLACLDVANGGGTWRSISTLQKSFRSVSGLYEAHVGQLLKLRWDAEGRAQSSDQRLAAERVRAEDMGGVVTGVQDVLSEKLGGMGHQLAELQHELRGLNAGFQSKMDELQQALELRESTIQALSGELAGREAGFQALSGELAGKESVIQTLSGELTGKDAVIQTLSGELTGKDAVIQTLSGELTGKDAVIQTLSGELTGKDAVIQALSGELTGKETVVRTLSGELTGKDSVIQGLSSELTGKESVIQVLSGDLIGKDSVIQGLSSELTGKESVIQALSGELIGKDSVIQGLSSELTGKESAIQALSREISDIRIRLAELKASTSWKITAPLRLLKMGLSPRTWKAGAGRVVKRAYDHLPLSGRNRLALKGVVFRATGPLLRKTRSYRAWHAFELHRAHVPLTVANVQHMKQEPAPDNAASNDASRVLGDLYTQSSGGARPDYVAMDGAAADASRIDVRAIAFYLPQFHPIPENDEWWGRGFTEWTNVSKAMPQFVGHYQPHLPGELGFYDLRVVDIMRRQVELARHYGLQGFCFHYYWFAGRRLLEKPIQQFLESKDIDFPFCVCWANENWSRRWDGQDQDILMAQQHSPEDDIDFIAALEPLLRDHRYIRVDGRPLIVLYRPSILPDAAATAERWRQHCREVGIGEIFLGMVQFDVEDPRIYGFDVAIEFPPHKLARGLDPINDQLQIVNPEYSGYVMDYGTVIDRVRETATVDFDMIRGVFPGWDNEARKPGRGYTFANATPARYHEWLSLAVDYARKRPVAGERIVFINAWNEWAEGAHLEPDRRHGYAYLDRTRAALLANPGPGRVAGRRVAIVSHDAHPHGAQYLALNMAREMASGLGLQVDVLLMGGGQLAPAFAETARVHDVAGISAEALATLLAGLRKSGVELVIANTVVAGRLSEAIAAAGLRVVTLVHELPRLIRDYRLETAVRDLVEYSDKVVLPSVAVRDGLAEFVDKDVLAERSALRPQGLFTRSKYRGTPGLSEARERLRAKLGLEPDARIVLAVGYADRRKGVDLLIAAAAICCKAEPSLHFVWVGHIDVSLQGENSAAISKGNLAGRFHFVGLDFDTDDYYAGSDLYALPSREDPFPSVVLESLSVGIPVVAFAGTGGGADLLQRGVGVAVPAFDTEKYAAAILELLADDSERQRLGRAGSELIDTEFSFRTYVMDLLCLGGMQLPRVSVVVPNFNYARYLPGRLASITAQSIPVYEIIVLDDNSNDDSIGILQGLRHSLRPEPRIVVNHANSGSVFRQWQRGVQLARGDYVWIAEADDLSKPDFLERMLKGMSADDGVTMGYCQSEAIDEDGLLLMPDYLSYTNDLSGERWAESYLANGNQEVEMALGIKNTIPNVSAVLFRRQALCDVMESRLDQVLQYKVAGDWFVYLHILRAGKVFYDPHVSNSHRRHRNSVTLGTAADTHYGEVVELQECAKAMFPMSAQSIANADGYRAILRDQLGIAPGPGLGG